MYWANLVLTFEKCFASDLAELWLQYRQTLILIFAPSFLPFSALSLGFRFSPSLKRNFGCWPGFFVFRRRFASGSEKLESSESKSSKWSPLTLGWELADSELMLRGKTPFFILRWAERAAWSSSAVVLCSEILCSKGWVSFEKLKWPEILRAQHTLHNGRFK